MFAGPLNRPEMRAFRWYAIFAWLAPAMLVAGCGPGSVTLPPVLNVTPATLSFSASTAQSQTVAVSESGYTGSFTVSGCSGTVTTSGPSNGTLTVNAGSAGSCTLTIADMAGRSATVTITVTTVSVPIQ